MLKFITKGLSKVFGSKSSRDIKSIMPIVEQINIEFAKLSTISNDELRGKTYEFKNRIVHYLSAFDEKINELKEQAEKDDVNIEEKETIFNEIDKLTKDRDAAIEEILLEILPEAFAVVKETARRFSENTTLESTATQLDKDLSVKHPHITIQGDKVIYQNRWLAAGNEVVWNMVHYDVQLIGGIVLHQGKISEMATGEGKTLVSTLPAYLNALADCGVHIVTVNDYLAKRDSEWNAPIFNFLGLTVDCIDKHESHSEGRQKAYRADITYGTNNEFGFDYLRDNMSRTKEEQVQHKLHYAMVDEVDSVLVDDARTPLIISGQVPRGEEQMFYELKPRIERIVNAQKKLVGDYLSDAKKLIANNVTGVKDGEGGLALLRAHRGMPKNTALIKYLSEVGVKQILLKTENHYLQEQQKHMPFVDTGLLFVIDEKNNQIELTEKGLEMMTTSGEESDLFIMPDIGSVIADIENEETLSASEKIQKKDEAIQDYTQKAERVHTINQLLKAYCLFERDVEYVVMEDKVKIVDEQTGRIMEGRRYSDGLHQAIEAKENVKVEAASQTFATITLQNFFRMYHKLAGMTGTAETEAGEFWEIYKLDTVVIPTNRTIARDDREDLIYKTKKEKYNAIIDEISKLKAQGRPVLLGTTNVEVSELLSKLLTMRKIEHNVLNAKQHQREADIVAEAGRAGQITIATNMAGRGTDIKLTDEVKAAGGLAIIGSERHDSRRVDRQLRGRAGRQGDPGSSQFYISLEDDLMRIFGSEKLSGMMDKMGFKEGDVIQHSWVSGSVERAQKKVEENNFGIRKRLLEYDDVMNAQREVIYKRRNHALAGERISFDLMNMFFDLAEETVENAKQNHDFEQFKLDCIKFFGIESVITAEDLKTRKIPELASQLYFEVQRAYDEKSKTVMENTYPIIKQVYTNRGNEFKNIVIPFSDGQKSINIITSLEKSFQTEGKDLIKTFEQSIILAYIDQSWKEHLRQMDDLKQSVQMAVHEQKDPLIIYKLEAFQLFKTMLSVVNKDVTSFLLKARVQIEQPEEVKQAQQQRRVAPKTKEARGADELGHTNDAADTDTQQVEKQQPVVRTEQKIGRNDLCPCGSGKKFKHCHGA
ncbi:MAG: preprotein translocase subunit SecA [Bacteroidetes bacterium]|nr:preprotein translocase subunit SecA [Bacteroidota bacterium]